MTRSERFDALVRELTEGETPCDGATHVPEIIRLFPGGTTYLAEVEQRETDLAKLRGENQRLRWKLDQHEAMLDATYPTDDVTGKTTRMIIERYTRRSTPRLYYTVEGEWYPPTPSGRPGERDDETYVAGTFSWDLEGAAPALGEEIDYGACGSEGVAPVSARILPDAPPKQVAWWLRRIADEIEQTGIPATPEKERARQDAIRAETLKRHENDG